jgi:hypothetical protein
MKVSEKEFEVVSRLPSEKRYSYFIKRVADSGQVWGLWNDGWAMGVTDDGKATLPLWPAAIYAESCAKEEWAPYSAKAMDVHDFIDGFLPRLIKDGVRVAIFDTPFEESILVSDDELIADLKEELEKIE